jgi:hypothetical protein
LKPGAFKLWVDWIRLVQAPHREGVPDAHESRLRRRRCVGLTLTPGGCPIGYITWTILAAVNRTGVCVHCKIT